MSSRHVPDSWIQDFILIIHKIDGFLYLMNEKHSVLLLNQIGYSITSQMYFLSVFDMKYSQLRAFIQCPNYKL
jgi:hypothetical protein